MNLSGKAAIITGGGTGLGAAAALKLAERGVNIAINFSRSAKEAEETAAAIRDKGVKALCVKADVRDDADCRAFAAEAHKAFGRIDMLVNNAGITRHARHSDLDALSAQDFLDIYHVNVVGPWHMVRACLPALKASGFGTVVNVASVAGKFGVGSSPAYAASKGALITLTQSMARALAPEVRVNAIAPGFIGTRWFKDRLGADGYAAMVGQVEGAMPLRKAGTPEEVADWIVFLCAEGAQLTTGEAILIDAGAHLDLRIGRER